MKLSHDPNNTKWTKDTQSFGHKIMASQGWTPGDHLGVKGAAHAELHTDANFSHIRVTIKDDNLGLGAKVGSGIGPGECTGLDAFQNLLGRLNGRDEQEMEKEQKSREDLKRAVYAEQKWGTIRFVKGGLLVGDKIQTLIDDEKARVRKLNGEESESSSSSSEDDSEEEDIPVVEEKKSKKRKLEDTLEVVPEVVAVKVKKSKKRKDEGDEVVVKIKKSKKSKPESSSASDAEVTVALKDVKLSKKLKKSKRESAVASSGEETSEDDEARSLRRKEKKERKREKRERKQQEKEAKSKSKREKKKDKLDSLESSKATTPVVLDSGASGTSTPIMMQGRHAVRSRNIAQKRLANMDLASLNQVCTTQIPAIERYTNCNVDFHD